MDKDRIKGKVKDMSGRVQRQAGEWTGSEEHQVKGTMKQAEGKVQNTVGKVKDMGRDALRDVDREAKKEHDIEDRDIRQQTPRQRRTA